MNFLLKLCTICLFVVAIECQTEDDPVTPPEQKPNQLPAQNNFPNYFQNFPGFDQYYSNQNLAQFPGFGNGNAGLSSFYPQFPNFAASGSLPTPYQFGQQFQQFPNNFFSEAFAFPAYQTAAAAAPAAEGNPAVEGAQAAATEQATPQDDAIEVAEEVEVVPSSQIGKTIPRPSRTIKLNSVKSSEQELAAADIQELQQDPAIVIESPSIEKPVIKEEEEFTIPEEAIVDVEQLEEDDTDHSCRGPLKRGRRSCTGFEAENSGLRWYYSQKDFRCYTFIYTGCGGNNNNYATKQECQQRCFVADGPSCAPGGKSYSDKTAENCNLLQCPLGAVCRMGAFFASCCDAQMEEYSSQSYADNCPNGSPAHEELVSTSCLDLICPANYHCTEINPFYARCCSATSNAVNSIQIGGPQPTILQTPNPVNPATDPVPATGPDCSQPDTHPYCSYWALISECESNPDYMHFYCKHACKLCKKSDGDNDVVIL